MNDSHPPRTSSRGPATREAIEAHLTIVFTALAVAHCIQERSSLAIANVIKQLRPLRSASIVINGASQTFPPEIPEPQRKSSPISESKWLTKPKVRTHVVHSSIEPQITAHVGRHQPGSRDPHLHRQL